MSWMASFVNRSTAYHWILRSAKVRGEYAFSHCVKAVHTRSLQLANPTQYHPKTTRPRLSVTSKCRSTRARTQRHLSRSASANFGRCVASCFTPRSLADGLQEFPIIPWKLRWRELFLEEMLRLDGRGEALKLTHCPSCKSEGFPAYRCEDCRGADLCKECMLRWHRYAPLHKIEVRFHTIFLTCVPSLRWLLRGDSATTMLLGSTREWRAPHWACVSSFFTGRVSSASSARYTQSRTSPSYTRTAYTLSQLISADATSGDTFRTIYSSCGGVSGQLRA